MKYFRLFFLTVFLFVAFLVAKPYFVGRNEETQFLSPTPQTLGVEKNNNSVDFKNQKYLYAYFSVENNDNLTFIPNFEEKAKTADLVSKYGCRMLSNAGFYTQDGLPTGLIVNEGKVLYQFRKNTTLNGILSINDFATARITDLYPSDHLRLAVQTGPIIIENSKIRSIKITNDKFARRSVAIVDGDNKLYFLIVYNESNLFSGPKLSDLGEIVSIIGKIINIVPADALNLDGGSASAFVNESISLNELEQVGGVFCYK